MCFASGHDGMVTPEVQSHLNGLAFMVFQNWYRSCVPSPLDYGLSQKTLLILKMMGTEETTTQIGRRIGMTKDGVAWHLKTARRKLGCAKPRKLMPRHCPGVCLKGYPRWRIFFREKKVVSVRSRGLHEARSPLLQTGCIVDFVWFFLLFAAGGVADASYNLGHYSPARVAVAGPSLFA